MGLSVVLQSILLRLLKRVEAAVLSVVEWFRNDFMVLNGRRIVIVALLIATYSLLSQYTAKRFYASSDMPPAFRNMDMSSALRLTHDYLDSNEVGSDTILVLGDCVAYGHGSAKSFSHYLNFPGRRIVNLSMQSYNYSLMLDSIDYAARKGVKNFVLQIHPFENFFKESKNWKKQAGERTAEDMTTEEILQLSSVIWRKKSLAMINTQRSFSFREENTNDSFWQPYSNWLRTDFLASFDLFRNRFIVDNVLGIQASYFSIANRRRNSFAKPMTIDRQIEIFKRDSLQWLWKSFVIEDFQEFEKAIVSYSPQARIAKYAQEKKLKLAFVMVPTFIDKIIKYTQLSRVDFISANEVYKQVAKSYGASYYDYLDDPNFPAYMYHYDNLTADGHKVFGSSLQGDLGNEFTQN